MNNVIDRSKLVETVCTQRLVMEFLAVSQAAIAVLSLDFPAV